ncbi:hypothetical protein PVAND_009105 [Polypedilum vanderplanki]|uniref:Uncharacterized protein n=1 Tax=Polypedilum vanderplanki TaxID=319348 RepID=A0A9J6CBM0_POLVA|nr:hypothetical protein PVAND_009105 [Polypedilum vanderplanki]
MESDSSSHGRFKVSTAPQEERIVGRFRLNQPGGGSPFLQRGRFSVIPEEGGQDGGGSPITQTKLSGPKIVVEPSPEWDFVS